MLSACDKFRRLMDGFLDRIDNVDMAEIAVFAAGCLDDEQCKALIEFVLSKHAVNFGLKFFEVTMQGFKPHCAKTDKYISWVAAKSQNCVEAYLFRQQLSKEVMSLKELAGDRKLGWPEIDILILDRQEIVFNPLEYDNG